MILSKRSDDDARGDKNNALKIQTIAVRSPYDRLPGIIVRAHNFVNYFITPRHRPPPPPPPSTTSRVCVCVCAFALRSRGYFYSLCAQREAHQRTHKMKNAERNACAVRVRNVRACTRNISICICPASQRRRRRRRRTVERTDGPRRTASGTIRDRA